MPAPYNITGMNNTNLMEKMVILNDATNNYLGIGLLLLIGFTLFFSMKNFPIKQALASSVFITTIIGGFLFIGGVVSFEVIIACVVLTAITTIIMVFSD